jgi:two-component system OmpR family sensor kinase/two-component system sensor histidine kinase BaeS
MVVLVAGSMALLAALLTRFFQGDHQTMLLVWIGGCGLSLALPILAVALGARVFRSYAIPLADMMDAADAVAAGNLTARVQERGSQEFQRLARSFNRMTEELARTDQQRRNLAADVAHELRTPLHIIQGNLEGILDGVYPPTPQHLEATLEETRQLARLVDDLRTLSLAEANQLPLVVEPVEIPDLLADVTTSFSGRAEELGIALCVEERQEVGGGEPSEEIPNSKLQTPKSSARGEQLVVQGDAGRLDQVLSNLVSNALRHTPPGGSVTLAAVPVDDHVQITVTDTGEGIAPADLPFLFDRFWKGDRARSQSGSGSGLGLSIADQLVKAHGGQIRVTSTVGAGTTFWIVLPRERRLAGLKD